MLELESSPILAALKRVSTRHVYVDTANARELTLATKVEIDGNTVNQPPAGKVVDRYPANDDVSTAAKSLLTSIQSPGPDALVPLFYAAICGRMGKALVRPPRPGARGRQAFNST